MCLRPQSHSKSLQSNATDWGTLILVKKKYNLIKGLMVPVKCMLHIFLFRMVQGSKHGPRIPAASCSVRTGAVLNSDHMARWIYWHDAAEDYCTLLSYPFYHFHRSSFIFHFIYSVHLTKRAKPRAVPETGDGKRDTVTPTGSGSQERGLKMQPGK